ncbi:MAG: cheA [Clostridiales bacterium]|nr:cheA [Clostridiales bacterium]
MVILTDVTDQKLLEKRMEEERYSQHLIVKAVTYKDQIKQLMEDLFNYITHEYKYSFSDKTNPSDSINEVYRIVHTFKGDFSQFGFLSTATNLHKVEDQISYLITSKTNLSLDTIQSIFASVKYKDIINSDLEILHKTFGDGYFQHADFVEVSNSRLEQVINKIISLDKSTQNNQIIDLIKGLKRKNLRDYLKQFDDYLHYLADRLQKNHPNYTILSDDIYVDLDQYRGVIKSLGHLYRNMLDHGIESDEERVMLGKSSEGNISCEMMISNGIITISIGDDGRGIDQNKVKQKAIDCKIATPAEIDLMSEDDILNIIFIDCFSTNECTNMLSGRGVGMAAVKYECEKIGGKISISTQSGKGTKYIIELPKLV